MGTNADFKMDWDNIRIFLSVARAGQFSAAASQLRIDNGTVGRRINALEKSLGVRLFDRQTTGSVLTAAGDALQRDARRAWERMQRHFETAFGVAAARDLRTLLKRAESTNLSGPVTDGVAPRAG